MLLGRSSQQILHSARPGKSCSKGNTSLKSLYDRDSVFGILTKNNVKMMNMQWDSLISLSRTTIDLQINRRKSVAADKTGILK